MAPKNSTISATFKVSAQVNIPKSPLTIALSTNRIGIIITTTGILLAIFLLILVKKRKKKAKQ